MAPPLGGSGFGDGAPGDPGVGLLGGEGEAGGMGFGPEHLGEVAKLTRLAADIFRRVGVRPPGFAGLCFFFALFFFLLCFVCVRVCA